MSRSHLPAPTVVNLQQAFKSWEDWVGVMSPADGYTDISVDRHEYQVTIPSYLPSSPPSSASVATGTTWRTTPTGGRLTWKPPASKALPSTVVSSPCVQLHHQHRRGGVADLRGGVQPGRDGLPEIPQRWIQHALRAPRCRADG